MKRIGALNGMRWLVLSLIFQAGYTAAGTAQEVNDAPSSIQRTSPPDISLDSWTGRIEQDTTWRDTVYVSGDVTIGSGATLTLAPHTAVRFLPYHDETQGGLDSSRAELIVAGRLQAQAEGIVFGSADAASWGADWYGIVVERGGRADVSNATIRDGLRCLYAKRGGLVRMDHIAFVNCGKPTAQALSQRSAPSDRVQVDSGHAASGLRAMLDSLLGRTAKGNARGTGKRIVKKLSVGALGGFVGFGLGAGLGAVGTGDGGAFGGDPVILGGLLGYTAGTAVGVTRGDPHDHFILTLLGSLIGMAMGLKETPNISDIEEWSETWPVFACPVIGATIMSELSRYVPAASRLSLGVTPDRRGGLSAFAALRF